MRAILTGFLEGTIAPADFVLRYRIGNAVTDETTLELHGDGRYAAASTATADGRRRAYDGALAEDDVRALAGALAEAKVWDARHVTRMQPKGAPPARITVAGGGREAAVEVWVSEVDDVPQFAAAQDAVLALIRRVSDAEVLEPGR